MRQLLQPSALNFFPPRFMSAILHPCPWNKEVILSPGLMIWSGRGNVLTEPSSLAFLRSSSVQATYRNPGQMRCPYCTRAVLHPWLGNFFFKLKHRVKQLLERQRQKSNHPARQLACPLTDINFLSTPSPQAPQLSMMNSPAGFPPLLPYQAPGLTDEIMILDLPLDKAVVKYNNWQLSWSEHKDIQRQHQEGRRLVILC